MDPFFLGISFFFIVMVYFLFYGVLALAITTVCFFMARNDEKRSGVSTLSGKSAIIFTLMNKAWWIIFMGWTLILVTFVIPGTTDLASLRIGFALALVGIGAVYATGALWKKWSGQNDPRSSWNMFVKCYSGLNVFMLFATVVTLVAILLILILELVFNDAAVWENGIEHPFKISIMILIPSVVFLAANLSVFGRATDKIVPFGNSQNPAEE